MRRGDVSRLALAAVLGLLVVLGLGGPAADGAAAASRPTEHAGVAQLVQDDAVAHPGQPVQPAPGGFLAVVPGAAAVPAVLARRPAPHPVRREVRAADRSTRPVRAPPASSA